MSYSIRKATIKDLAVILKLRDQAREIMRSNGNFSQWPVGYPPDTKFRDDIKKGYSHVMLNEKELPVASFALIPGPDPTYNIIYEGNWLDDTMPYHVIHRIVSTPDSHGVLQALLDYCEAINPNIRIDTHADNSIMRNGLEKHGYRYCGIIHLANGDERLAFQKPLKHSRP